MATDLGDDFREYKERKHKSNEDFQKYCKQFQASGQPIRTDAKSTLSVLRETISQQLKSL